MRRLIYFYLLFLIILLTTSGCSFAKKDVDVFKQTSPSINGAEQRTKKRIEVKRPVTQYRYKITKTKNGYVIKNVGESNE